MRRFPLLLLALPLIGAPSDPGGVLSRLTIASFPGSIQSTATDSGGNIFVAGTTASTDFPSKNAAQPASGEARILRSPDLGVTWTRVGLPPSDVTVVVPDPVDSQVIFAAGNAAIFKTADGGQSWATVHQFQPTDFFNGVLVIDPGNHLRLAVLLVNAGTLLRSFDGGNTWTAQSCPLPGCGSSLVVDPSGSGALIFVSQPLQISRDWGSTLQTISAGGGSQQTAVAFDPSNPGWIYVAENVAPTIVLALSKDFGKTWTTKTPPTTRFSSVYGLQVDPHQPNIMVAASPDGFYESSDGANSWSLQTGTGGSSPFRADGFHPFTLLNRTCAAKGGLFAIGSSTGATYHIDFSPDDGITWMTPQLTGVTNIAMGPGCTAYATRPASSDAFVAKLSPNGAVQWATFWGGSDQDAPVALTVDTQGNCYVTGNTSSQDFPATVPLIGIKGQEYAFVTRFSPNGAVAFSAVIGGENMNTATSIAVDLDGSTYLAGITDSMKFPVTPGVLGTSLSSGSFTGFVIKLSPNGEPVYSTYLGPSYTYPGAIWVDASNQAIVAGTGAAPGLPQPSPSGSSPAFVVKLNPSATQTVSGAYLQSVPGGRPTALLIDPKGNLLVFGSVTDATFTSTPGAYASPPSFAVCSPYNYSSDKSAFLLKLDTRSLQPVSQVLLSSPCGVQTGTMALDPSGDAVFAMATDAGLALQNPLLAGPTCGFNSNAIAKLSADGSSLQFATYLDGCGVPGIAMAGDGSIVASSAGAVLNLTETHAPPISLNRVANAFSGDSSAVTAGGLYTLTGSGFQPSPVDLRFNPSENLPEELGGVKVLFDGMPASILQVAPGRVIVAAPERLVRLTPHITRSALTSIQISYNGSLSDAVWMPVANSVPGLLTTGLLNPQATSTTRDGYVQNQDGTLNSSTNPATAGSTITLFVTGAGATNRLVAPGSVAQSGAISPETAVYATWRQFSFGNSNPPETVNSIPGFVSAMFAIPLTVPTSVNGQSIGNGIRLASVGLMFLLAPGEYIPPASNLVGVYVK
jgi:uncharacterized protein (TIGR03437 family)